MVFEFEKQQNEGAILAIHKAEKSPKQTTFLASTVSDTLLLKRTQRHTLYQRLVKQHNHIAQNPLTIRRADVILDPPLTIKKTKLRRATTVEIEKGVQAQIKTDLLQFRKGTPRF